MVKIGIIGYGIMGQLHHQACMQYPGCEVAAVCNRSTDKLEIAKDRGAKSVFTDYREMLKQQDLQAVIVALPDRMHLEATVDCLRAGCDVLLEKPMATSLDESVEMRKVAAELKRKLMVNYSFRWEKDLQCLKNAIDQGSLGELKYLLLRVSDIRAVPLQWLSWGGESSPSEFLLPHSIDLARWLSSQEIERVYALQGDGVLKSKGLDTHDFMVALCEMSGGLKLCLETSWILPDTHPTPVDFYLELQGSEGTFRLDRKETGIESYLSEKAQRPITWMYTLSDGKNVGFFFDSVRNFLEWITGEIDEPMSTVDDGVRGVAVLEAILKSARERKPVQVQEL